MSDDYLNALLRSDPRIRTVAYLKDPFTQPKRVARSGIVSIDAKRDEAFTTICIPAVMGSLQQYCDDFGELLFVGGVYERLNFVFFSNEAGIFVISYDKVPMDKIVDNLRKVIDSMDPLSD